VLEVTPDYARPLLPGWLSLQVLEDHGIVALYAGDDEGDVLIGLDGDDLRALADALHDAAAALTTSNDSAPVAA
jgi:hypothetical protein